MLCGLIKKLYVCIMDMGKIIKTNRQQMELSQSELSKLSGVATPTISKIETGKIDPKMKTLYKLMDALGLTVNMTVTVHDPEDETGNEVIDYN